MAKKDPVFGLAKVGAKGQIVIPVEFRQTLEIEEGDQLILLMGKHKKTLLITTTDSALGRKIAISGYDSSDI